MRLVKQLKRGSEMQSLRDMGTAIDVALNFPAKPAGMAIASGNDSKRDWVSGGDDNHTLADRSAKDALMGGAINDDIYKRGNGTTTVDASVGNANRAARRSPNSASNETAFRRVA